MWREYFKLSYAVEGGMLFWVSDHFEKGMHYSVPVGKGDLDEAIRLIRADARERNIPLRFCSVPDEAVGRLSESIGRPCESIECREWADYLYPYSNFLGYHGKKLVTQRNHCNRFQRDYPQYEYRVLTEETLPAAKAFLLDNREHFMKDDPLAKEDYARSIEALDCFEAMGYTGGLLTVDSKAIGLTFGEAIGDTLYVQAEKALTEYSGAYPMLAQLYARQMAREGLDYINREDDSGDPGLRRSKTEYRPIKLIGKYILDFGSEE